MLNFFKTITFFTRSEKRGILILIILILIIYTSISLYSSFRDRAHFSSEKERIKHLKAEKEYEAFISSLQKIPQSRRLHFPAYRFKYNDEEKIAISLFPFDPNTVDSITFRHLGLPAWMTRNILHYRKKGGVFHKAADFKKIYGLTAEQYNTLLPYITIRPIETSQSTASLYQGKTAHTDVYKYPAGTTVDINLADTTDLKKIPGIGSGIARLITGYRKQLGGFYQIEQLEEIHLKSKNLQEWLTVHPQNIKQINLNKASVERLKAHPYFNFYQAKAIVEYRKKKGKLTSLKPFTLYDEFTEKDIERITPYICFE